MLRDGDPVEGEEGFPFRRILLIGFMGSGKSTVGALLARSLGWDFADADEEVEREAGKSVASLFEEEGEATFRTIEDRVTRRLLHRDRIVLASGGGWPCRPGRMEGLPENTLSIWLIVSPESVVERVRAQGIRRPLIEVPDPETRTRELLAERMSFYGLAMWSLDTQRHPPAEIVRLVVERLKTDPERPLHA